MGVCDAPHIPMPAIFYIFRGRSGEAIVVSSASKAQNMACARTFRWDCLDLSHVVLVCVSIYCLDRAV